MEQVDDFLYAIISDTIQNLIYWKSLDELTPVSSELLELDEFNYIDSYQSYYATIQPGQLWLVYETVESGKDANTFTGYRLYIRPQNAEHDFVKRLPCDPVQIERLANAVIVQLSQSDPDIESFIEAYMNPDASHSVG